MVFHTDSDRFMERPIQVQFAQNTKKYKFLMFDLWCTPLAPFSEIVECSQCGAAKGKLILTAGKPTTYTPFIKQVIP